jgi:hypothetical protein
MIKASGIKKAYGDLRPLYCRYLVLLTRLMRALYFIREPISAG